MNKMYTILYLWVFSVLVISTNSFAMMAEEGFRQNSAYFSKKIPEPALDIPIYAAALSKKEKSIFDEKLPLIKGKNMSNAPLSEEMYKFIIGKVGENNNRKFVFKTGPQIIFEDEADLQR
ncbi:MAG: hypothetical protein KBD36_00540 [Alphaproteobacteria bacterium]|nr:hypothetical protein [Alphaproteobacteria bacterium]MBP9776323.1 hypothetical protein [Alphaproteobacteria bacterium]